MKTFLSILQVLLVFAGIIIVVIGFTSSAGAPQEAAAAGLGCFLLILARLAQAEEHNIK